MTKSVKSCCHHYGLCSIEHHVITAVLLEEQSTPPIARTAGLEWRNMECEDATTVLANGMQWPDGNWRWALINGKLVEIPEAQ